MPARPACGPAKVSVDDLLKERVRCARAMVDATGRQGVTSRAARTLLAAFTAAAADVFAALCRTAVPYFCSVGGTLARRSLDLLRLFVQGRPGGGDAGGAVLPQLALTAHQGLVWRLPLFVAGDAVAAPASRIIMGGGSSRVGPHVSSRDDDTVVEALAAKWLPGTRTGAGEPVATGPGVALWSVSASTAELRQSR
jgi:hypothetical protein